MIALIVNVFSGFAVGSSVVVARTYKGVFVSPFALKIEIRKFVRARNGTPAKYILV